MSHKQVLGTQLWSGRDHCSRSGWHPTSCEQEQL